MGKMKRVRSQNVLAAIVGISAALDGTRSFTGFHSLTQLDFDLCAFYFHLFFLQKKFNG